MTQVIRLTSEFIVGQFLRMIEDNIMNVVLPPAFGTDAKARDFDWVSHPIHGVMWSNYQFVDMSNGNKNFTHMVPVAPLDVFRVDPGDRVCRSALGLCPVPPPQFTYQTDLTKCGYEVVSQFVSALQKGKSLATAAAARAADTMVPLSTESTGLGTVPEDISQSVSKATEKCKVKCSMKNCTAVLDDPLGRQKPNEMEANTNAATIIGSANASTTPPVHSPTLNQAQEMVCHLFNQSKILDECRVRVAQAGGMAVSRHSAQTFLPFMSYLSTISNTVEAWHTKITVLCLEMANCDYDTYRDCVAEIWEKTREYFGKLRDLNTTLEQQTSTPKPMQTIKPSDEDDSGIGSSTASMMMQAHNTSLGSIPANAVPTNKDNPFSEEITSIMKDVKSSIGRYVQAMTKVVAEHLGGVEVTLYLGHIFSTRLNFQMSMWQLVMMEAIYLPTMMREHLHHEIEMLQLFAQVIPILVPCSIPLPPFPTAARTLLASQDASGLSVGRPLLPSLPGNSGTVTGTGLIAPAATPMTPSSGGTQPGMLLSGQQKLQSRIGSKLLSSSMAPVAGTSPSRGAQKSSNPVALSPLLMNIAQSSSNIRCHLGEGTPSNGQPNVKRQRLDESATPMAAGTSASEAIDIADDDDDDYGIEILETEEDGNDEATVVTVNTQDSATTNTPHAVNTTEGSTFAPFVLMDLHTDVIADIKGKNHKKILNQL